MTEAEQIMKRCQRGTRNYEEANNLHADCYRVIGSLLKIIEDAKNKEFATCTVCNGRGEVGTGIGMMACDACQGSGFNKFLATQIKE